MTKNDFLKQATNEQMDRILSAKSADELLTLAKEFDVQLNETEAAEAMEKITQKTFGELSDDELENVAGGSTYKDGYLVVTIGHSCDLFRRPIFGSDPNDTRGTCPSCQYHKIHSGFEVCLHTKNRQHKGM